MNDADMGVMPDEYDTGMMCLDTKIIKKLSGRIEKPSTIKR